MKRGCFSDNYTEKSEGQLFLKIIIELTVHKIDLKQKEKHKTRRILYTKLTKILKLFSLRNVY